MALLLLVPASTLGATVLSGALGMGGGMVLMGLFAVLLPVSTAMVLHGIIMAVANGSRAWILLPHIEWRALPAWALGAALSLVISFTLALSASQAAIFLFLGATPFVSLVLSRWLRLDFVRPAHGFLAGLLVTSAQLFAGASGPLLDIFFLRSKLDRQAVVATKSATQTVGHLAKVFYYGTLAAAGVLSPLLLGLSVAAAILGTRLGKSLLVRMDEARFRFLTQWVAIAIATVFLVRGFSLL